MDAKEQFRRDMVRWLESQDPNGDFWDENTVPLGMRPTSFEDGVKFAAAWAKNEVVCDIANGRVPPTVRTFAELHDHVDANGYGGAFDWPCLATDRDDAYQEEFARFWNAVQANVDAWLRAGRPGLYPGSSR